MSENENENENTITLGQTVNLRDHAGGNIVFQPGKGWKPAEVPDPPVDGDIIFKLADESDFLVLKANGDAFVRGEQVQARQEVYDYFAAWLVEANLMPRTGVRPAVSESE